MKPVALIAAVAAILLGCSLSERERASCPRTRLATCYEPAGCSKNASEKLNTCYVCEAP